MPQNGRMSGREAKRMVRYRERAYRRQRGLCYWCKQPMLVGPEWYNDPRQCSADHLVRHAEGGAVTDKNIVAACRQCNSDRDFGMDVVRDRACDPRAPIYTAGDDTIVSPFEKLKPDAS